MQIPGHELHETILFFAYQSRESLQELVPDRDISGHLLHPETYLDICFIQRHIWTSDSSRQRHIWTSASSKQRHIWTSDSPRQRHISASPKLRHICTATSSRQRHLDICFIQTETYLDIWFTQTETYICFTQTETYLHIYFIQTDISWHLLHSETYLDICFIQGCPDMSLDEADVQICLWMKQMSRNVRLDEVDMQICLSLGEAGTYLEFCFIRQKHNWTSASSRQRHIWTYTSSEQEVKLRFTYQCDETWTCIPLFTTMPDKLFFSILIYLTLKKSKVYFLSTKTIAFRSLDSLKFTPQYLFSIKIDIKSQHVSPLVNIK